MQVTSLDAFVSRVSQAQRLSFADLRRLQRDVLPNGPANRDELRALITLDRSLTRADAGWPDYLIASVQALIASAQCAKSETRWLASLLGGASEKTAQSIARAIIAEAEEVDDALRAIARPDSKRKPTAAA